MRLLSSHAFVSISDTLGEGAGAGADDGCCRFFDGVDPFAVLIFVLGVDVDFGRGAAADEEAEVEGSAS